MTQWLICILFHAIIAYFILIIIFIGLLINFAFSILNLIKTK